jgi:hypothetical protein
VPYSELNYLRPSQLLDYVHSLASVTSEAQAVKHISDAERIVDAYVGKGPRYHRVPLNVALVAPALSGATDLETNQSGDPNYWAQGGAYVVLREGVAAAHIGQARLVVLSDEGAWTLASGFDVALPTTVRLDFEQRSAFPREWDVDSHSNPRLPDLLARAVAYQVEFALTNGDLGMGAPAPVADTGGVQSRVYGSGYSETRSVLTPVTGLGLHVAPKARDILRVLINSTGRLAG